MRLRKQTLGNRNLVGARVELARKNAGMKQKDLLAQLQVSGIDLTASALSKLEGQMRSVTDIELVSLARILGVTVGWLLGYEEDPAVEEEEGEEEEKEEENGKPEDARPEEKADAEEKTEEQPPVQE